MWPPLLVFYQGDWPEERVARSQVVKRRTELQLRIVPQVAPDGAQAHSKHHEQNRE